MHKRHLTIVGIVLIVATILFVITTLPIESQTQQQTQGKTRKRIKDDINQFPVVDYDASELHKGDDAEKRKLKSKRYDGIGFVTNNPRPEYSGVGIRNESLIPAIPVAESEIVIIGEVLNAGAHLSNNKENVYSEFTVRIEELLKGNKSNKITQDSSITIDRFGGAVQYPNGQKLFYNVVGKDLPQIGRRYVLFLTNREQSPNFNILTGYELEGSRVYPLDNGDHFEKFEGMDEKDFIITVRKTVEQPLQKTANQQGGTYGKEN